MSDVGDHICSTPGCGKQASLSCPKCLELNIKQSYFCSQDCFKAYYKTHNNLHKAATYVPPQFDYTGPLRPFYVSPMRTVPPQIQRPDYADHPQGISLLERASKSNEIEVYTADTIKKMRKTCAVSFFFSFSIKC
eukprot:c21532_g1_i3.p1 GENE.c21532_g1_i3~~c21532_g1_i3.p1  ORF type:complete len:146 (+),score=48.93 c21532_g1_i3:35-439(+)